MPLNVAENKDSATDHKARISLSIFIDMKPVKKKFFLAHDLCWDVHVMSKKRAVVNEESRIMMIACIVFSIGSRIA